MGDLLGNNGLYPTSTGFFYVDVKPVICLMGPTASGKTNLAIDLLSYLACEIVSVDSAMIYRGMDIGTAKPSQLVLNQAPHRLIDTHDPSEVYSAAEFRSDAINTIEDIFNKGRIPLLVGGTMLYFHVLQHGIATLPSANPLIREQLNAKLKKFGLKKLHERLANIDPIAAQRIHPNDPQRILRALEVALISGKPLTELQHTRTFPSSRYSFINIALLPEDRSLLHKAIATRFHTMLEQGFIAEVEQLFKREDLHCNLPAIRTVGYRQIWNYLLNTISYIEMQDLAIIATRQLAKRQLTWLRSWQGITLFDSNNKENIKKIVELIKMNLNKQSS